MSHNFNILVILVGVCQLSFPLQVVEISFLCEITLDSIPIILDVRLYNFGACFNTMEKCLCVCFNKAIDSVTFRPHPPLMGCGSDISSVSGILQCCLDLLHMRVTLGTNQSCGLVLMASGSCMHSLWESPEIHTWCLEISFSNCHFSSISLTRWLPESPLLGPLARKLQFLSSPSSAAHIPQPDLPLRSRSKKTETESNRNSPTLLRKKLPWPEGKQASPFLELWVPAGSPALSSCHPATVGSSFGTGDCLMAGIQEKKNTTQNLGDFPPLSVLLVPPFLFLMTPPEVRSVHT